MTTIHYKTTTPDEIDIKPHRMDMQFTPENTPDYWLKDSPFLTTWMESLSLLFPEGEQFFVDSVRHFRDQVEDKKIRKEISGFIGQEAMHSLEHVAMNNYLQAKGRPAKKLEKSVTLLLNTARRILPHKGQLALTAGLEHITAMLANLLLEDSPYSQEKREGMAPNMRELWMWHAIEETEHKSVAFDLYQAVSGSYIRRSIYMLIATTGLMIMTLYFHLRMLYSAGHLFNVKDVVSGVATLYGRNGYVTQLIPVWLDYFRTDFHPWDDDNSHLVARWKETILSKPYSQSHAQAA